MVCKNPYVTGKVAFGCGKCTPCVVRKKREWQNRIILESTQHEQNAFVTLTYDHENLPLDESGFACLRPKDVTDFLKRLRASVAPHRLRYYLCGEYGGKLKRPHYHLALFGWPPCAKGKSHFVDGHCCPNCDSLHKTWGKGHVVVGTLTADSAGYIAKYITKHETTAECDFPGFPQPYSRMSRRPGLGYSAMFDIASTLLEYDLEKTLEDVPGVIKISGRMLPLGKYLKSNLRKMIGRDEKTPPAVLQAIEEELQPMYEAAYATAPVGSKAFLFKQMIIDRDEGKIGRIDNYHFNDVQKRNKV